MKARFFWVFLKISKKKLDIIYCEEHTEYIIEKMLIMWVLGFMGSMKELWPGDSKWLLRKPVSSSRLWISHLWIWHYKKCHLPLIRLLYPSSYSLCTHRERLQRLPLCIPFNFSNTKPDPETLLPSHSLKMLEKPPNFMTEINVFIQLQMLELSAHTSTVNTSPSAPSAR